MTLSVAAKSNSLGHMYANLFENRNVGVPRGLFWSFYLPCEPVEWEGEQWDTSLSCDWLQWPIHRWQGLSGSSLESIIKGSQPECSFYLSAHLPIELTRFDVASVPGSARFRVRIEGSLTVDGYGELDAKALAVAVEGDMVFEHLIVVPDSLFPKPSTPELSNAAVSPYIDLAGFEQPTWDRFRYVYVPRFDDA